ncbi:MAG: TonB-dependent receptor, partial [Verrucomicrobia bacterium]|nr:TonB-dependent receptor [Verrucomicrobiota bacterium]
MNTAAAARNEDLEANVDKKALRINLDATKYGTFAEIGAGQEVARIFFHVGGASGTIAKTISAYDMTFSDAIYGPTPRYVSRQRLQQMLEYEYNLLLERLADKRAGRTSFFSFANTVATKGYNRPTEGHGWLGVRFQAHPRAEPNQIIIHVRMLDKDNIQQQEALGIIGVNLIHGAFYNYPYPEKLIGSLIDSLSPERMQVDMIKFSGPDFHYIDNRLMALQLVEQGLADAV